MPDLATKAGQQAIEPLLENIELIVVDNIATLCRSGRENETESWKPVQEWALRMRASGRSVLFIHHSNKKGDQRGASAGEDILNSVVALVRPENYSPTMGAVFEVHIEKARCFIGEAAKPFEARLITDEQGLQQWITRDVEPNNYMKVVQLLNDGCKQQHIAKELNLHKSNVSRYTKRATEEGLLQTNGSI